MSLIGCVIALIIAICSVQKTEGGKPKNWNPDWKSVGLQNWQLIQLGKIDVDTMEMYYDADWKEAVEAEDDLEAQTEALLAGVDVDETQWKAMKLTRAQLIAFEKLAGVSVRQRLLSDLETEEEFRKMLVAAEVLALAQEFDDLDSLNEVLAADDWKDQLRFGRVFDVLGIMQEDPLILNELPQYWEDNEDAFKTEILNAVKDRVGKKNE